MINGDSKMHVFVVDRPRSLDLVLDQADYEEIEDRADEQAEEDRAEVTGSGREWR